MTAGHTDRATINERRPLTPTMRAFLRRLQKEPMRNRDLAMAENSPMRALMDRGLVQCSPDGVWTITDAGHHALINGAR